MFDISKSSTKKSATIRTMIILGVTLVGKYLGFASETLDCSSSGASARETGRVDRE